MSQKQDFTMKDNYEFSELVDLIHFLRSPEGCPWDREQTHESIQSSMIEEAWEAIDALNSETPERFADELGDVLLQVVFHSKIAEDAGNFNIQNVITNICRKLISRHTHIFANDEADNPEEVLATWEANKKKEKKLTSESQVLNDVPKGFPALMRSYKIQKKAAKAGFDWANVDGAKAKIIEETNELIELAANNSSNQTSLYEEAGDLLFAVVNTLRHLKIDPEIALHQANEKFIRRFSGVEYKALASGRKLSDMSLEEMDALWDEVKAEE